MSLFQENETGVLFQVTVETKEFSSTELRMVPCTKTEKVLIPESMDNDYEREWAIKYSLSHRRSNSIQVTNITEMKELERDVE
jgi:hypothetical protein